MNATAGPMIGAAIMGKVLDAPLIELPFNKVKLKYINAGMAGRCHISEATLNHLQGEYEVDPGTPNSFLEEHQVKTYFIKGKIHGQTGNARYH